LRDGSCDNQNDYCTHFEENPDECALYEQGGNPHAESSDVAESSNVGCFDGEYSQE
jgi:hypothetical protein